MASATRRDVSASIYGSGAVANEKVSLTVSDGEVQSARASTEGSWKVLLAPRAASVQPLNITVTQHGSQQTLNGVLFGDVWFCGGQSNMELGLSHTLTRNQSFDAVRAGKYAHLRIFSMDHNPQRVPVFVSPTSAVAASWSTAAAALALGRLPEFAATCWYFGESLADRLGEGVPIGLIESAFGGTSETKPSYHEATQRSTLHQAGIPLLQ